MNKTFAIINSENKKIISVLEKHFKEKCKIVGENENLDGYDLIVLTGFKTNFDTTKTNSTIINIHPALLPSFKCENAIKEAFLEGVKVSGITIHKVEKNKFFGNIIAQMPVLIGNSTHFDELEDEIIKLCTEIYPKVIETILNDKVFDFSYLLNRNCNSHCNKGCNGCCH